MLDLGLLVSADITAAKLRKRMAALKDWLSCHGAEVLAPTNEWELLRFRAGAQTGIAYRNARDQLTLVGPAREALAAHFGGTYWSAGVATQRARLGPRVAALFERDGDGCWLCGKPLGSDVTQEHLVAVAHGGPNHLSNLVLAHGDCNNEMGHLSVAEKVRLREVYLFRSAKT